MSSPPGTVRSIGVLRRRDCSSSFSRARCSGVTTSDTVVVPSERVRPILSARLRRWTRSFGSAPSGSRASAQWSATSRTTSTEVCRAVSVSASTIAVSRSGSARRRIDTTVFTITRAASTPTSPAATASARTGYRPGSSSPVNDTAGASADPSPTRIRAVECDTPVTSSTSSTPSRAPCWNARDSSPRVFLERLSSWAATPSRRPSITRPIASIVRASSKQLVVGAGVETGRDRARGRERGGEIRGFLHACITPRASDTPSASDRASIRRITLKSTASRDPWPGSACAPRRGSGTSALPLVERQGAGVQGPVTDQRADRGARCSSAIERLRQAPQRWRISLPAWIASAALTSARCDSA